MIDGLRTAATALLSRAGHLIEHHPRQVTVAVAAILLLGGGGALAVSTADELDAGPITVREVLESVRPASLQEQLDQLDTFRFNLFRSETVRSSDTAESLLARLGINDPAAAAFLRSDATFRRDVLGRTGRGVSAEASDDHALVRLTARWAAPGSRQFQRLVAERAAGGSFQVRVETANMTPSLRMAGGVVRSSFFQAMDDGGVPDEVARQVLGIFEGDIDFHRGLHPGDRFTVAYEALEADGEVLRAGRVLSAEFVNRGQPQRAMWFQPAGSEGGYFDLEGRSLTRAFLASPLEFTRVTSQFAMRMHPVLQQWMKHDGVDYGGPVGTPVRSIGDGIVREAGLKGSFGNLVVVDHGGGEETYYAHLSRIDVRPGQRVQRGQYVGRLGATGRVTGPHLHFEFRVKGVSKDPRIALRRPQPVELNAQARAAFEQASRAVRHELALAANSAAAGRRE